MIELIVLIFIVLISSVLGVAIYQNNPKSATNLSFVGSAVSIIFWSIVMYLSVNTASPDGTLFYIRLSMLAGTVMAIAFLLLSISFPYPTLPLSKKWLLVLGTMGVITSIVSMSPYMFTGIVVEGGNIEPTAGWGIVTFMITSLGSNIATFIVLVAKFIKSKGRIKEQLRFIVVGTLTMFTLLIVANFLVVIILKTSSFIFLGPVFTLIFLLSVGYAILRHKLLDIRTLIARAVSYTFLLAAVVIIEAAVLWLGTTILPPSVDRTVMAFIGSILIVMSYNSLRAFINRTTDKLFFQDRYDTEDLLKSLTQIMVREMQIDKLTHEILLRLTHEMKVVDAAFIILKGKEVRSIEFVGFASHIPLSPSSLDQIIQLGDKPLIFEEIQNEGVKEFFRANNLSLIIPLGVQVEKIGFLVLGPKSSGDIYTERDLEFLEIFAPQAAIAIKNAESYREIQEFNTTLSGKVFERTRQLEESQAKELKLKDEFVFIATHDLATPVTAISGFTSMINNRTENISPALKNDLSAITEASGRLKVLVNDLLQVARSDSGTIKVELSKVDAGEIIESAIRQAGPFAAEKKVEIITSLAGDNHIQADPKKLAEIIENLISNGIKYNKEGGSLTVTTVSKVKTLTIEFKDTGLGIDEKEQGKVFTKFFRSEEAEVRQRPGTGLGLFVVRMLTEKMGGTITFKSKPGIGTTFWLEFQH